MAIKYQLRFPELPKVLFGDISEQTPDHKNNPEWVIKRVFERGSMGDIAEIMPFHRPYFRLKRNPGCDNYQKNEKGFLRHILFVKEFIFTSAFN